MLPLRDIGLCVDDDLEHWRSVIQKGGYLGVEGFPSWGAGETDLAHGNRIVNRMAPILKRLEEKEERKKPPQQPPRRRQPKPPARLKFKQRPPPPPVVIAPSLLGLPPKPPETEPLTPAVARYFGGEPDTLHDLRQMLWHKFYRDMASDGIKIMRKILS